MLATRDQNQTAAYAHTGLSVAGASGILKALGHPMRLQIAIRLRHKECNVNRMVEELGLPQSTVSQHLGILKTRGIITCKKEGVSTCYWVEDPLAKQIIDLVKRATEKTPYAAL
jgi:ArsR family transcriptional regulator